MKSASVRLKLKLDREENKKRLRDKRKSKKIEESLKRGNALNARSSRRSESRKSASGDSSTRRG